MSERWRAVVAFEGIYEVSDLGRVRSIDRVIVRRDGQRQPITGRVLRPYIDPKYGHHQVDLRAGGVRRLASVHQLVLEAFVGPRPSGMEACHNSGDALDNRASNLRWDTHAENMRDMARHGTRRDSSGRCANGHVVGGENLRIELNRDGSYSKRICVTCRRETQRRYKAKKHQAVAA